MKQWLTLVVVALAVVVACDQADTTKPACTVVVPAAGDTLDPGSITIKVIATDDKEMKLVEFYVGNRRIGEDATAAADTFEAIWDASADTTGGTRLLKAVAFDAADNFVEATAGVVMRLPPEPPPQDTVNPFVRLLSPDPGDTIELDTVVLKAWARDNVMLEKVEFYAGATKLGEDVTGTADTFTFDWDASSATPGSVVLLKTTAVDTAGNTMDDTLAVYITPFTGPTYHTGDVTGSEAWSALASPHIVTAIIDIKNGARVTIEAGATVLFDAGAGLTIGSGGSGELVAAGRQDSMIRLSARTTARSDTTPGSWKGIHFYGGAGAACRLSYCDIAFAGEASTGAVATYGGSKPTVDHCRIRSSAGKGVTLDDQGGHVIGFSSNTISDCASYPLETYADFVGFLGESNFLFPNDSEGVLVHGGTVNTTTQWTSQGPPFVITSTIRVEGSSEPVLSLGAGVVLQFKADAGLLVGTEAPGGLQADGSTSPQAFTSAADRPRPGDWLGLTFGPQSIDSRCRLVSCRVEYGGAGEFGNINITDALPTVQSNFINYSAAFGIYLNGTEYPDPDILETQNFFEGNVRGSVRRP